MTIPRPTPGSAAGKVVSSWKGSRLEVVQRHDTNCCDAIGETEVENEVVEEVADGCALAGIGMSV